MLGLGVGAIFTAIGGAVSSWMQHKTAKVEAARTVEVENIRAGVEIQKGSWKDEYFTIFWTWPLYPVIVEAGWKWDPSIFINFIVALPVWYQTLLIGMTTASFGVKTFKDWKAGMLDREMKWDRHKNGNGNGSGSVAKMEKPKEFKETTDGGAGWKPNLGMRP